MGTTLTSIGKKIVNEISWAEDRRQRVSQGRLPSERICSISCSVKPREIVGMRKLCDVCTILLSQE